MWNFIHEWMNSSVAEIIGREKATLLSTVLSNLTLTECFCSCMPGCLQCPVPIVNKVMVSCYITATP